MLVLKKFGSNKMLVQNIVSQIFCQDWVSDSWDIPNMDKCSQDKSCIDKCHMSPWQLAFVKEGPRNLPLKFGQNLISIRWDIPDMDKSRHDKCCLDECHSDSLNLLKMVLGPNL